MKAKYVHTNIVAKNLHIPIRAYWVRFCPS